MNNPHMPDPHMPDELYRKEYKSNQPLSINLTQNCTPHRIDSSKIKSLEDVVAILDCMNLVVYDDGSERFAKVRHLYQD